jgi:glycosylphosphatidylinositol deacylase
MLWVLPINLPVLVVWVHNLAVHWLTPFSSHHNILSIMPYILIVETTSTGHVVPRLTSKWRLVNNIMLFSLALYAAVYGVSYAYVLHHLVNGICAWLVIVHFTPVVLGRRRSGGGGGVDRDDVVGSIRERSSGVSGGGGGNSPADDNDDDEARHVKKRP